MNIPSFPRINLTKCIATSQISSSSAFIVFCCKKDPVNTARVARGIKCVIAVTEKFVFFQKGKEIICVSLSET